VIRGQVDPDRSKSWLRRVIPVALAHRLPFGMALLLALTGTVLQVQVPYIVQRAIDESIVSHRTPLEHYVWWLLIVGAASGVTAYVGRVLLFRAAADIEADLRNLVFVHLMRMSFPFYDRVQSGQLISRASSDIRIVQMYLAFSPVVMVQLGMAVVAFGYMLSIDVSLAFVAMATIPLVFVATQRMRRAMFPVSWLIQARLADVATIVDESVNGVRVVKAFAAEQQQVSALERAARKVQWAYVKDTDLRAAWGPVVQNLPRLGLALVLFYGGYEVIHGAIGVGALVAFNSYLLFLQGPFQMLGMIIMMGQRAAASATRVFEILDAQPDVAQAPDAQPLPTVRGEVVFDAVGFGYGEGPPVLHDFSLTLRPGETVALVGRTASGKSTVARLVPRFYDVNSGAVRIDGQDVRTLELDSLRENIGLVLDEPFLFSASVRENIAFGRPDASQAEVEAAARAAGADGFVRALAHGYETVVGERGYTLSGGQRQRIAIARALLVNPPILILDDATSAIDVQIEQQIHRSLRVAMAGRTTLIIAHRLSTIGLADRVVLMDDGRIVADGTHDELLATVPLYADVLAHVEDEALDEWVSS
jgi:ATP-binding cassette subfamily B protein